MKTRSFHHRTALLCAMVLAMAAPLRADDLHLRIKIPNPIPKIVKGVKRVGVRVGDIVVRTAERIDGDDQPEMAHRGVPPPYLAPLPPPERATVRVEPPKPPMPPRYGDVSPVVTSGEAAYRPLPPSAAVSPSVAVTTPAAGGQPTAAVNMAKPTPPPEHAFGKPVPGRPGLVYPPGMKEIPANMIDVRGIMPGTKVRDPATKMVFRVP